MDQVGLLSGTAVFLLLGLLGCMLLGVTGAHRATLRFQVNLFLAGYLLRFTMSLVLYAMGVVNLFKDEDGSGWLGGVGFQQGWVDRGLGLGDVPGVVTEAFLSSNRGYQYLLGLLYCLVEPSRLPAAALNCFFGALAIVFAYRTAASLFSIAVARRVGIWLCIFPSLVMWSAQTVKEPVVILLETMVVYGCVRLRQSKFPLHYLVVTVGCIILLIPFRFYAAYLAAAALIVSSIFPASGQGRFNIGPKLGALMICGFFAATGMMAHHESQYEHIDLDNLQDARDYTARTTGSGVGTSLDVRTGRGFGLMLVIGTLHLFLAPFPWQLASGSVRMLMVAPEMIYWWWLVFAGVIPGLGYALRKRFNDVLPLMAMLLGFGLLYSVTFMNVGLIYRQRAQLMPWLLTFAAVGLERRRQHQSKPPAVRPRPKDGLPTFAELEHRRLLAVRASVSAPPELGSPERARNG